MSTHGNARYVTNVNNALASEIPSPMYVMMFNICAFILLGGRALNITAKLVRWFVRHVTSPFLSEVSVSPSEDQSVKD